MPLDLKQDAILKKYAELITSKSKAFKRVYFGDPIRIPTSSLPALILAKVDTRVSNFSNAEDMHQIRLSFTVVTDIRNTITEDKEMVAGVNDLYNLVEGRDETTLELLPTSLLYILRHNAELDVAHNLRTDLDTMSTVSYGMTMGKRKEEAWSIEAMVELVANFTQVR